MPAQQPAFLELAGISKSYPGVLALDDVSFAVAPGEVVGLIGENGAGKSTLMKVLGGIEAPTKGAIRIDGRSFARLSVAEAISMGIAFVHQELNLFDNLDVAANVLIGREPRHGWLGLVDRAAMIATVAPLLERVGASFGPEAPVAGLSLAERQMLEIAKALSLDAKVVIMDEPTSSLTLAETGTLLGIVADLSRRGIAVIFISHRLSEIEQCADRVVVLRDGTVAGRLEKGEITHDAMIRLMIGRDLRSLYTPPSIDATATALSIRRLRTEANPQSTVDLELRAGEILGVAGLVGAGRTEVVRAVFGIDRHLSGTIALDGRPIDIAGPAEAIAAGIYLVPEDRKESGLIIDLAIAANITLASVGEISRYGLIDRRREDLIALEQRERLAIRTPDVGRAAAEMSGGNQQKVVLAKWLSMRPKVILLDEPTRGIDVGAKTEIYKIMRHLADSGVAIMMISSDMEEVIGVSDRICVMHNGAIAGMLERAAFSEHAVLTLAVGKPLAPFERT